MAENLHSLAKAPLSENPFLYQEWSKMAFLHWRFDPAPIQKTLPKGLFVDTFEGNAYLGIVAFKIQKNRFLGTLSLPFLQDFVEVNLRTYVRDKNGLPGVWFYSLDIDSFLMTSGARLLFSLPYCNTPLKINKHQSTYTVEVSPKSFIRQIHLEYQLLPSLKPPVKEETLEHFLIERYLLFSARHEKLTIGPVRHLPYPLTSGELYDFQTNIFQLNGFENPNRLPDHCHYSEGVNVNIYRVADAKKYSDRVRVHG